jgi:predicted NBD/HSP70 family sugar kinase
MKILFDIGGSKMRVSSTVDGETFTDPVINKTPKTAEEGVNLFFETVKEIRKGEKIEGLWGGITGVWDKDRNSLAYSPNMKGWVNKPIRKLFEEKIGAPMVVENDADVVGLGEVHYGAGTGSQICVYITISTGVGGARIVDGCIDEATVGFEPGHQIINSDSIDVDSPVQYASTLEGNVSGTALEKQTGLDPRDVTDPDTWERLAFLSAVGIFNSVLFWSPDRVIVGGSMVVGEPNISIDRIEHHVRKLAHFLPFIPEIKKAELGAIGGIYGALALTKKN